MEKPNIFKYLNYRNYLRDVIEHSRNQGTFTYQDFASQLGFKSRSHLRMIIEGQRNLSLKSIPGIAKGLQLTQTEETFLETMVKFNQAKEVEDEQRFYQELLKYSSFKNVRQAEADQFKHFGHWYVLAILESLGTAWRKKSEHEMVQSLEISMDELKAALKVLERLKLITKDGAHWKRMDEYVITPPDTGSDEMEQMYREMGQKAVQSIEKYPRSKRSHTGLTLALTEQQYLELKQKVFEMQGNLNFDFPVDQNASHIYQLNIQLFPLCQINPDNEID